MQKILLSICRENISISELKIRNDCERTCLARYLGQHAYFNRGAAIFEKSYRNINVKNEFLILK